MTTRLAGPFQSIRQASGRQTSMRPQRLVGSALPDERARALGWFIAQRHQSLQGSARASAWVARRVGASTGRSIGGTRRLTQGVAVHRPRARRHATWPAPRVAHARRSVIQVSVQIKEAHRPLTANAVEFLEASLTLVPTWDSSRTMTTFMSRMLHVRVDVCSARPGTRV